MIEDFLRALATCIKEEVGGDCALYFGRLLQGAKKPCLVLRPPVVSRRVLSGGRVQREYGIDLRFYPAACTDLFEQQAMGEKLICALDEIVGENRNYRGRELEYEPKDEYLAVSAHYDVIMLKSMESKESAVVDKNIMLELGFVSV